MKKKEGLTLNAHGKFCLSIFIHAISGTDILTTQLDYLVNKDLVDRRNKYKDFSEREEIAGYCLTDLGMITAKRYFPNFKNWPAKFSESKVEVSSVSNRISKPLVSGSCNVNEKDVTDICPKCGKHFCNVIGATSCYECSH